MNHYTNPFSKLYSDICFYVIYVMGSFIFFSWIYQHKKDIQFAQKFSKKCFIPLSGIYQSVNWDDITWSGHRILGKGFWRNSLPYLFYDIAKIEDFSISLWYKKGRMKVDTFSTSTRGDHLWKSKGFSYEIRSYDFEKKNSPELKFALLIVKITRWSIIFFVKDQVQNWEDLRKAGIKIPVKYASIIPMAFPFISQDAKSVKAESYGYDPFLNIILSFPKANANIDYCRNIASEIIFRFPQIQPDFQEQILLNLIPPESFIRDIFGELSFFTMVFRQLIGNPFIDWQDNRSRQRLTANFFHYLDEYSHYIENLAPDSFNDLKNYLYSIGTITKNYVTMMKQLIELSGIDQYSFENYIFPHLSYLMGLSSKILDIYNLMESNKIRPQNPLVKKGIKQPELEKLPKSRIFLEDVDNFKEIQNIGPEMVSNKLEEVHAWLEKDIKALFEKILGENFGKKDWGGEMDDIYTTNVKINGNRIPTAFVLKGRGTTSRFLRIGDCGANGDQIVRLFDSPAQLFVIQHVQGISEELIKDVQGKVDLKRSRGENAWFLIIDGQDLARLLSAYERILI